MYIILQFSHLKIAPTLVYPRSNFGSLLTVPLGWVLTMFRANPRKIAFLIDAHPIYMERCQ
jgi:hypothetical protein